ncbi:uncharacterized protein LOC8038871 [Ixodes scapularis]|uniref:uncharacterized protein LOC8038871 n=1 Tax=Ixodes scapularis TaxID=6945 RepID=UPI001A9E0B49|nr:uncharacterized protein LOC8038871 [Ixodes scapularis]
MAILKRCCCWKSVRKGSFASALFTLFFYSVHLCAGVLQINAFYATMGEESVIFVFVLLMVIFSGFSAIASLVLIIGLCTDNRLLLLPWIACVSITTILDVALSFYFLADALSDLVTIIFCIVDYTICALNIYCLLCVVSQYQEYLAGRGRSHTVAAVQDRAAVRYRQGDKVRTDESRHNGPTSSLLLTVPTVSASTGGPRMSTDMSSISEDVFSSRRMSTENTSADMEPCPTATLIKIKTPP